MSTTTRMWSEDDVERDVIGRFDEKSHTEPEVSLAAGDESEPVLTEFHMRASRLANAQHRIELANRRLERAGIDERFESDVEHYVRDNPENASSIAMVKVSLSRPSINYGGWEFATAHQATPDGHVLNFGPHEATDMHCDHCGHNRQRGSVYTVTHPESGETKQIGGNCMEAFLGIKPKGLWALTDDILEQEDSDFDDEVGGHSTVDEVYAANALLLAALAASNDGDDFRSRAQGTTEDPATVDAMFSTPGMFDMEHPAERQQLAGDIQEWLDTQPSGESDYIDNLRGVLAGEDRYVSRKHSAIAVSVIGAYKRAMADEVERAAREEAPYTPGFLGEPKERIRDLPVTLVKPIFLGEDTYGWQTKERWLLVMRTEDGKTAKWFTTGSYSGMEPGEKYLMTATVKSQEIYEGKDETLVTRAALTLVDSEDA